MRSRAAGAGTSPPAAAGVTATISTPSRTARRARARRDQITDFAPGQDVLDLARIDADPSLPGDQPFVWRGTAAFTGAPGEVRYVKGATTIVQATIDGDLAPELEIRLTGNKTLTEDDVRL